MKVVIALPVAMLAIAAATLPAQAWFLPGELNLERGQTAVLADPAYISQQVQAPRYTADRKALAAWHHIF